MKLLSTIAAICLSVAIATAAEVGAPIQARQAPCSVTLFRGRNFTGAPTTISASDTCARVNEPFISGLFSARASPGCVCFLYTSTTCNGNDCAVCVDSDGFRDMTAVDSVRSVQCTSADAFACSGSGCRFGK